MKIIKVFLLLVGITTTTYAGILPTTNRTLDLCLPVFKGGLEFGATAFYLRPTYSELDFGLTFPNPTLNDGIYKAPSSSYDLGYQFSLGYQFPCTSQDVRLSFQEYTQTENDNIPLGFFFPISDTTPIELVNTISTFNKLEIKDRVIDFDFGQFINIDQYVTLRLLGGLRYVRLENILTGGVIDPTLDLQPAQTVLENQKSTFKGFGPRFGGEAVLHLGAGFGLVGALNSGMIIGHTKSFLATTEIFNLNSTFRDFQIEKACRVVPNLEGRMGINFRHQFRNCSSISLEGGYYVNQYFDAVDWLSPEGLDNPALRTRHSTDTSFSGTYISLQAVL